MSHKYESFLTPASADKRWRELIKTASRPHPFQAQFDDSASQRFPSARKTVYNTNFSAGSKREYRNRVLSVESVPPAGRSSFFRELLRPEVVDLCKNAEYQKLLHDHMLQRGGGGLESARTTDRSSLTSSSRHA
jgi:hypothetical protein